MKPQTEEHRRLGEDARRRANWKRWGPYLSERQWGTVREDYSPDGNAWSHFPHDQARSRAYRWGEDGLLGITDRECRLCFALALWNRRDPILKERLFGLAGMSEHSREGNHGEDVKESYYYLDATPTHSWMRALYQYPQLAYPYDCLVTENRRRGLDEPEFELADTGVFEDERFFDVEAIYAKAAPDDLLVRIRVRNRGPDTATLHLLPTIWFRNTWSWGCRHEGCGLKPRITVGDRDRLTLSHETLGDFSFRFGPTPDGSLPEVWFTENETNTERLYGVPNATPYVKDAFHRKLIEGDPSAVNPALHGTKAAAHYVLEIPAGETRQIDCRLTAAPPQSEPYALNPEADTVLALREREADDFYDVVLSSTQGSEARSISRQAYAGLLWNKQFYHYIIEDWLRGDPEMPSPPATRKQGRNADWTHLYSRDVLSVPDKWEYPWFAIWDTAFHMIPFARLDPHFAKDQLVRLLREWYMHPNGEIPAYEFAFDDVNPPVHAWAAWRIYLATDADGQRDRDFLERTFQKLLLNFTWWVNRKDSQGNNLFEGGFLGLDNIGVFDRSKPLPTGGHLQQADATAWMAFYSLTLMSMALELAREGFRTRVAYEDMASKFFEHFIQISDAMNHLGGTGLWDETDGCYYDQIHADGCPPRHMKIRSLVGLLPLIAVAVLEQETLDRLPGFQQRFRWFLKYRRDLARQIAWTETESVPGQHRWLLALPSRERLERVLHYLLDEAEFLSPYGIRSLSKVHQAHPYVFETCGQEFRVDYQPGESNTVFFGGNSNWRGPIWFPVNYLIIEALDIYHHYYGEAFKVECPTGSGRLCSLREVADDIARRLVSLFLPDADGRRPCLGQTVADRGDESDDRLLFHEYFHAETGRGLGASHQTGWTALVTRLQERPNP